MLNLLHVLRSRLRYAALYSQMSGSKVMVLCCCAVGNVYPISRATDYKAPNDKEYYGAGRGAPHSKFYDGTNKSGFALKPGYDAHWFCVSQPRRGSIVDVECYIPDDERFPPCYDEIVVKEEKQVLPIAIVRFGSGRAPKDGFKRAREQPPK